MSLYTPDTIIAIASPAGTGAISVIRISGPKAIDACNALFHAKDLHQVKSHTIHYGHLINDKKEVIDEVMISVFKAPKSFTTEDSIEISCHGSPFICQQIIEEICMHDVRLAEPGEFSMRAFLNGRIDLVQAEAVADLIAVNSEKSKQIALHQLRGVFSTELQKMRTELIDFAALIELELDFSEEDVAFADRSKILELVNQIQKNIRPLIQSFKLGNAIKNGIPVAIVGKPNSGKSTLLNALLNEERAIVSDIAGTTRDTIEDTIQIDGILYRFIDTAGLRSTIDTIEYAGIERAKQKIKEASIVLYVADINENYKDILQEATALEIQEQQELIFVLNKLDTISSCDGYDIEEAISTLSKRQAIAIAAKNQMHIDKLKNMLATYSNSVSQEDTIINNIRHYEALRKIDSSIDDIRNGVEQNIDNELIALDIRRTLQYIGQITGEVEVDRDILGSIFGKFCIGK